jgi:hypothetical protein
MGPVEGDEQHDGFGKRRSCRCLSGVLVDAQAARLVLEEEATQLPEVDVREWVQPLWRGCRGGRGAGLEQRRQSSGAGSCDELERRADGIGKRGAEGRGCGFDDGRGCGVRCGGGANAYGDRENNPTVNIFWRTDQGRVRR